MTPQDITPLTAPPPLPTGQPIEFWDRNAKCLRTEVIYGEGFMRWVYETSLGRALTEAFFSRKPLSKFYGVYNASLLSRRKIKPFIRAFNIPMEEYEDTGFRSFNDFFIRKFKPGVRPFEMDPHKLPAWAEGRYLAYASTEDGQKFPVKGSQITAEGLVGREHAAPFVGGPLVIARLCPVDYHRYHYPDAGETEAHYTLSGALHSVNPIALKTKPDILFTNERRVAILKTRGFGRLAYVEVGALAVGKIVQTHDESRPFRRGDEKGYFLFGGSTVVVMGEKGAWRPDQDLLDQTQAGRESMVRVGEAIAKAL